MFQIERESAFLYYFSELFIKIQAKVNLPLQQFHLFLQARTLLLQFEMKHEDCWSYQVSFIETAATRTACSSSNHFTYSINGISYSCTGHSSVPSMISLEPLDG